MTLSTGMSLLKTGGMYSDLSYVTTTLTTRTRSATATPNPDNFNATGFTTTGTRGVTVNSSSSFIDASSTGTYPSYTLLASVEPVRMGNYTATLTPIIRDSQGVVGTTSGSFLADLTRDFTWTSTTSASRTVSNGTDTIGLAFDDLENCYRINLNSDTLFSISSVGNWNTLPSISQTAGAWNEVQFQDLSGSTDWVVTIRNKNYYEK
jgi:hypothetical protein